MGEPLVFRCNAPQAWNVGALEPTKLEPGEAISVAPPLFPESEARVYPPDNHAVRMETGKREAAVMIYRAGELVAVLWPDQVAEIVKFWGNWRP